MKAKLIAILIACLIITGACTACMSGSRPGAVSAKGVPTIFAATMVIRDLGNDHVAGHPVCGAVRVAPRVAVTAYHCVVASSHTPAEWALARAEIARTKKYPDVTGRMLWVSTYQHWEEAQGEWREMEYTQAFIGGWDALGDVAVMVIGEPGPYVEIRRGVPRRGEPIQAIHHTANLLYSFSAGHMSALRTSSKKNRKVRLLQLDLAVSKGASGSGAFDAQDRLVGIGSRVMFTGKKSESPMGIAFYSPVSEFSELVEQAIRSGE